MERALQSPLLSPLSRRHRRRSSSLPDVPLFLGTGGDDFRIEDVAEILPLRSPVTRRPPNLKLQVGPSILEHNDSIAEKLLSTTEEFPVDSPTTPKQWSTESAQEPLLGEDEGSEEPATDANESTPTKKSWIGAEYKLAISQFIASQFSQDIERRC